MSHVNPNQRAPFDSFSPPANPIPAIGRLDERDDQMVVAWVRFRARALLSRFVSFNEFPFLSRNSFKFDSLIFNERTKFYISIHFNKRALSRRA